MNNLSSEKHDNEEFKFPTVCSTIKLGSLFCGCAGFSNPSWVGNFYPRNIVGSNSDRQLDHYQQHFSTVEINSTFYGHPKNSTLEKWKRLTVNGKRNFHFVLKAKKSITHENKQRLNTEELEIFLTRSLGLGESLLDVVLIQCPSSLVVTTDQLEAVFKVVQRVGYKGKLAFEFRHVEVYHSIVIREYLKQQNWSLVYHPNSVGRFTMGNTRTREMKMMTAAANSSVEDNIVEAVASLRDECGSSSDVGSGGVDVQVVESLEEMARRWPPTADFVYVRLHGPRDDHYHDYSMDELSDIAHQIHRWRGQGFHVYCFFLNDAEGRAESSFLAKPTSDVTAPFPSKASARTTWNLSWCAMPRNALELKDQVNRMANEYVSLGPKLGRNTIVSMMKNRPISKDDVTGRFNTKRKRKRRRMMNDPKEDDDGRELRGDNMENDGSSSTGKPPASVLTKKERDKPVTRKTKSDVRAVSHSITFYFTKKSPKR